MTETHRIRYYGPDDMTYNMHLHKSEQYVEAFDYDMENQTLLDVIEMHNVLAICQQLLSPMMMRWIHSKRRQRG